MKTLERAVEDLQKTCNGLRMECDRRRREAENAEKTVVSCKEQNKFLNERNMKLVKKCEELCEENKAILNRCVAVTSSKMKIPRKLVTVSFFGLVCS